MEDDQRVSALDGFEAFGQEHVGSEVHGPAPEFGEQVALDPLVLDVLGGFRVGDFGNDLVHPDDHRRGGI